MMIVESEEKATVVAAVVNGTVVEEVEERIRVGEGEGIGVGEGDVTGVAVKGKGVVIGVGEGNVIGVGEGDVTEEAVKGGGIGVGVGVHLLTRRLHTRTRRRTRVLRQPGPQSGVVKSLSRGVQPMKERRARPRVRCLCETPVGCA